MSVRASKVGVYVSNSGSDVEVSINGLLSREFTQIQDQ